LMRLRQRSRRLLLPGIHASSRVQRLRRKALRASRVPHSAVIPPFTGNTKPVTKKDDSSDATHTIARVPPRGTTDVLPGEVERGRARQDLRRRACSRRGSTPCARHGPVELTL
jgi:hypothetical protein